MNEYRKALKALCNAAWAVDKELLISQTFGHGFFNGEPVDKETKSNFEEAMRNAWLLLEKEAQNERKVSDQF